LKHNVGDNDLGFFCPYSFHRLLHIGGPADGKAAGLKDQLQDPPNILVIIKDQDIFLSLYSW
jgi:hypothetical protein